MHKVTIDASPVKRSTVAIGDILILDNLPFMLVAHSASSEGVLVMLASLKRGNRWDAPSRVQNMRDITAKELRMLIKNDNYPVDKVQIIRGANITISE